MVLAYPAWPGQRAVNPLDSKGNYSASSWHQIILSWYTGRWWVGCYIWYSEEGPGRTAAPPSPLLAVPNVTAHPSTASVPITVLLYDGPFFCGFSVTIKGLNEFVCLFVVVVFRNHRSHCSCAVSCPFQSVYREFVPGNYQRVDVDSTYDCWQQDQSESLFLTHSCTRFS